MLKALGWGKGDDTEQRQKAGLGQLGAVSCQHQRAEKHPSVLESMSGSSGVTGAGYEAPLKQGGLVKWGLVWDRMDFMEKLDAISVQLDCWGPPVLARLLSGKVRW